MDELIGKKPEKPPPRTEDFEALERKIIDVLIDSINYIAATCGIVIVIYSQILQQYLKSKSVISSPMAQLLVFSPLLLWFLSIIGTVAGIYPRKYKATTDLEKQKAINKIPNTKRFWLIVVLYLFLSGFALFLYIIIAQIRHFFPFQ